MTIAGFIVLLILLGVMLAIGWLILIGVSKFPIAEPFKSILIGILYLLAALALLWFFFGGGNGLHQITHLSF